MFRFIKRSVGLLLCMSMLLGMNVTVFAKGNLLNADSEAVFCENVVQEDDMQSYQAKAPAKPVYKIEIIKKPVINPKNNHLEIKVNVWGYGKEMVTFNGKRVFAVSMPPIYEGGMQVGVSYTYDCGEKPAPGEYDFVVTYTDYGFPYDKHTANWTFKIDED